MFGFQASYGIPIFLKLLFYEDSVSDFKGSSMSLGRWSRPLGVISCVWLFGTNILFFLPQQSPITASSFNYACVAVASFTCIGAVYCQLRARFVFAGPRRTTDVNPDSAVMPITRVIESSPEQLVDNTPIH